MTIRHIVAAKPSFVPTSPINCVYSMTGKVLYPSPMIMGVPKSANTRMNTSSAPASSAAENLDLMFMFFHLLSEITILSLAKK